MIEEQTPSLSDAGPRSDRFQRGGREGNFLAVEKEKFVVKLGEEFEARVVKPNERKRCIDLTIKAANYSARLATYSEQASAQSFENALQEQ